MEDQVQYRIGWLGAGLMLGIAIAADLLQILLTLTVALALASFIVSVIAESFIVIYFMWRKVGFLKGKGGTGRFIIFLITTMVEMVPFLDALPTLTFYTAFTILSSRKQDRQEFKEKQEKMAVETAEQDRQENEQLSRRAYYEAYAQKEAAEREEEVSRELEDA